MVMRIADAVLSPALRKAVPSLLGAALETDRPLPDAGCSDNSRFVGAECRRVVFWCECSWVPIAERRIASELPHEQQRRPHRRPLVRSTGWRAPTTGSPRHWPKRGFVAAPTHFALRREILQAGVGGGGTTCERAGSACARARSRWPRTDLTPAAGDCTCRLPTARREQYWTDSIGPEALG